MLEFIRFIRKYLLLNKQNNVLECYLHHIEIQRFNQISSNCSIMTVLRVLANIQKNKRIKKYDLNVIKSLALSFFGRAKHTARKHFFSLSIFYSFDAYA